MGAENVGLLTKRELARGVGRIHPRLVRGGPRNADAGPPACDVEVGDPVDAVCRFTVGA